MEKPVSAADANRKFHKLLRGVREGQSYVVTSPWESGCQDCARREGWRCGARRQNCSPEKAPIRAVWVQLAGGAAMSFTRTNREGCTRLSRGHHFVPGQLVRQPQVAVKRAQNHRASALIHKYPTTMSTAERARFPR